jgi:DNA-directed RNA polymerase specialized sigma24 family protein
MTGKPPSPEAFDKLLAWLDPDREQAGQKYQKIQSRLISIFSCHGCAEPEKLADETIDRVTAKIDWLLENYVGEPIRYFCGVSRNVLKEDLRSRVRPTISPTYENEIDESFQEKHNCLDKCMSELTAHNQSLVLAYYEAEGQAKIVGRKKLAEQSGITLTALRIRVFHIRVQLSKCLKVCLESSAKETL